MLRDESRAIGCSGRSHFRKGGTVMCCVFVHTSNAEIDIMGMKLLLCPVNEYHFSFHTPIQREPSASERRV